jgi:hypothetical protein
VCHRAPQQLHLKEAILGVDVPQPEGGVRVIARADQRDAVLVAGDRHLGLEPRHRDPALDPRQRRAEIEREPAAEGEHEQQRSGQNAADHRRARSIRARRAMPAAIRLSACRNRARLAIHSTLR